MLRLSSNIIANSFSIMLNRNYASKEWTNLHRVNKLISGNVWAMLPSDIFRRRIFK